MKLEFMQEEIFKIPAETTLFPQLGKKDEDDEEAEDDEPEGDNPDDDNSDPFGDEEF